MPQPPGRRTANQVVQEIAASPEVAGALAWPERHAAEIIEETVRIAEIPAPTFAEGARAAYVSRRFHDLGLEAIATDAAGNVYGLVPGPGRAAAAFAAHMDTVFAATVDHSVTRRDGRLYGAGVGDNSAGLAGMLCAIESIRSVALKPARPLWFVATTGEEGLGNLRGSTAATDRLGAEVDAVVAVEGSFFGRLSHTGVGSRRLEIACRGPGGHSWHDFGRPSAVHALSRAAAAITALSVPSEPRTTFNIGRFEGGTGVNVIADEARLLLDMRSVDPATLDDLTARVRQAVSAAGNGSIQVEVREVGFRPAGAIGDDHPLVGWCAAVLRHMGVTPQVAPASTDANIPLSRGIPAVTLGITRGGGAHTRGEWIDIEPLRRGVQQLALVALTLSDPRAGYAG